MNSLTELKQVVDSMKLGIEDDAVDDFQQNLSNIGAQHTNNSGVTSVVKMMQSLARYLGAKKDNADDVLPVLNTIVLALEKLLTGPDLDREQVNQILSKCIQTYNALKRKIASRPLVTSSEMQELKAVILAVDWEITEKTMKTFDGVTSRLLTRLKPYKIHHAFLRIIHSMGRYIASKKAAAHQDSIFLLRAVFENFERIVQTPDMSLKEKQQLIEEDINAFHNFKRKITPPKENAPVSTDNAEDEFIQPALSHVKVSNRPAAENIVPLSSLTKEEVSFTGQSRDSENKPPALADGRKKESDSRDVMDELFSPKESPADELLDAIHLANIQGPDQKKAMNMGEPTKEELQKTGIKNFTPRRIGNEPIPEIGNRLDEFFNLENTGNKHKEAVVENKLPPGDDNCADPLVPFQYEDESFEETAHEDADKEPSGQEIILRLKALLNTPGRFLEEGDLSDIDKEIFALKTLWQDDLDKIQLIDIISVVTRLKINQPSPVSTEAKTTDSQAVSITEQPGKRPIGFWGKVKQFFKSK